MGGLDDVCVNMLNAIGNGIDGGLLDKLALGPAQFNEAMHAMSVRMHDTAVKPASAAIASIICTLELERTAAKADGDRELGVRIIGMTLFRCALILLFAGNALVILDGIDSVCTGIIARMNTAMPDTSPSEGLMLGDQMRDAIEKAGAIGQSGLMILVLIPFLVAQIAGVVLIAVVYLRFMQLYMLTCFASLPVVFLAAEPTRQMGIGYFRRYGQTSFQAIVLSFGIVLYRTFIGDILQIDDFTGEDLWGFIIDNFGNFLIGSLMLGCLVMVSTAVSRAIFGE